MPEPSLHSPAHIVSRVLIARGLANEHNSNVWPVFVGREPNLPDNCITIRNTTGRSFGFGQVDGVRFEHPGFQIRIRSTTEDLGYAKARAIALALDSTVDGDMVILSGVSYQVESITRESDIINLGKESPTSVRHLHTINATAVIRLYVAIPPIPNNALITPAGDFIVTPAGDYVLAP